MSYRLRRIVGRTAPVGALGLLGLFLLLPGAPDSSTGQGARTIAAKVADAAPAAQAAQAAPAPAAQAATTVASADPAQPAATKPASGPQLLPASLIVAPPAAHDATVTKPVLASSWSAYLPTAHDPVPGDAPAALPGDLTDGQVGASAANVRSGPSSSNPVKFVLPAGENIRVGESSGSWVHVYRQSGEDGWVYRSLLGKGAPAVAASPTRPAATPTVKPPRPTRQANAAPPASPNSGLVGKFARAGVPVEVRAAPAGYAGTVYVIEPGEPFRIDAARNGWMHVQTAGGGSGWIPG
jgi:SH3-like domain-containing protein